MTEAEYIQATNFAKLRSAIAIVGEVMALSDEDTRLLKAVLYGLRILHKTCAENCEKALDSTGDT